MLGPHFEGWDAEEAQLALFSREGFDVNLSQVAAEQDGIHLIDLATMYGPS